MKSFKSFFSERCWTGYKSVPGKKPYTPGSCVKEDATADFQSVKKDIISLLKSVREENILQKVLKVLQSGDIEKRIKEAISNDSDAKAHIETITNVIVDSSASVQEKDLFLSRFKSGIVDVSKLIDGRLHSFKDVVGSDFAVEVFKKLITTLTSQGIGPGELALAVLSPKIKSVGAVGGGGDIIVNGVRVEVKASVKSGGRWVNARKAKVNLPAIKKSIELATGEPLTVNYLSAKQWVQTYRPMILSKNPKKLSSVCAAIANGMFNQTSNVKYKEALEKGNAVEIAERMLEVGFENYKTYSNFTGILLIDTVRETLQYFTSFGEMKDKIESSTPYVWCSGADELMPKVKLKTDKKKK